MRGLIATVSSLVLVALTAPALAQSATKIGQHNAWGTYSYKASGGKVCYVLTVPTDKQPPTLDHGDMFFFVSQRPGQSISYEPQFIAGYNLREGSKVAVTIGDKKFSMFTKGKSAWVENAAEEPALKSVATAPWWRVVCMRGRHERTSIDFVPNRLLGWIGRRAALRRGNCEPLRHQDDPVDGRRSAAR